MCVGKRCGDSQRFFRFFGVEENKGTEDLQGFASISARRNRVTRCSVCTASNDKLVSHVPILDNNQAPHGFSWERQLPKLLTYSPSESFCNPLLQRPCTGGVHLRYEIKIVSCNLDSWQVSVFLLQGDQHYEVLLITVEFVS